jgi:hypothetical protein
MKAKACFPYLATGLGWAKALRIGPGAAYMLVSFACCKMLMNGGIPGWFRQLP